MTRMLRGKALLWLLVCLAAAGFAWISPASAGARTQALRKMHAQVVPADFHEAWALLARLDDRSDSATARALRVWLWRRDLITLQGKPLPPPMTVDQAIASPLADGVEYGRQADAWLASAFPVTLMKADAPPPVPEAHRQPQGFYTLDQEVTPNFFVLVSIGNRSGRDAIVTLVLNFDAPDDVRASGQARSLICKKVNVPEGASVITWCDGPTRSYIRDAVTARLEHPGVNPAIGMETTGNADLVPGPLHIVRLQPDSLRSRWEQDLVQSDRDLRAREELPDSRVSAASGELRLPTAVLGILIGSFALLGLGAAGHLTSARDRLVPRGTFYAYLVMAAVVLMITSVDTPGATPMGGSLGFLAQMVAGLPWTAFLLGDQAVLPNGSHLPMLLVMGNGVLLFAFSSRGNGYQPAATPDHPRDK